VTSDLAAAPASRVDRRAPQVYDFRRPNRFSREHVRALQIVNETFARQFSTVLSSTLRVVCQANVVSVGQITYDEYVGRVPNPSLLAVLSFDPLPGAGVFQLPMAVVMNVVDRLLGGPGGQQQPIRPLSDIENGLVRGVVQRVVHELTYAFESLSTVSASVVNLESDAQFMQLAPPSEPVIVSELEVRIGEHAATSTLCLPFATLQPVLDAIGSRSAARGSSGNEAAAARAVECSMQGVAVDVAVAFRPVTLTSHELLGLAVGDLLPLRHPVTEPLAVEVDGVPVAAAVPGSHGQRLACQVVSPDARTS
jgi:flagellar motor switch protein FliM